MPLTCVMASRVENRQVQWSIFARRSPSPAAFPMKKEGRLLQLCFEACLAFTHVICRTVPLVP
jgi:hypothetical protein